MPYLTVLGKFRERVRQTAREHQVPAVLQECARVRDEDRTVTLSSLGKTYSVTLPGPVPAKNFWSFMLYSGQTRSILETDQKSGGIDSKREGMKANDDRSVTVYFGPEAPEGMEANWAQTVPGKSFNAMMRLYGPLEPWFDKSWKPGDFVPVEH